MSIKLSVSNLNFSYYKKPILCDLKIDVFTNDRICIKGVNGSGKSTFLKILSGIISSQFNLFFHGERISNINEFKRKIAYIPDIPYLNDYMTGYENIKLISYLWELNNDLKFHENLISLLTTFNLDKYMEEYVHTYSLGMKQKLFFIAMLARDTEMILLDEPFSAFDVYSQQIALNLLLDSSVNDKAIIFVSHLNEIHHSLANKTMVLENGQLRGF